MKQLRKRLRAQLTFLVLILFIILGVIWLSNFHVHKEIDDSNRLGSPTNIEVLNDRVYFTDNSVTANLCTAKLNGLKFTHRLGIHHVKKIKGINNRLYVLCEKNRFYVYDIENEDIIKKIDLVEDVGIVRINDIDFGTVDKQGAVLHISSGRDGDFVLTISPEGEWKKIPVKQEWNITLLARQKDVYFIHITYDTDGSLNGIFAWNISTNQIKRISEVYPSSDMDEPAYIWEDELIISKNASTGCRIKLDGSGEKEFQTRFSVSSCVYEDKLYTVDLHTLYVYDLKTGEIKENVTPGKKEIFGRIRIFDNKLFVAGGKFFVLCNKTKIYFEELKNLKWIDAKLDEVIYVTPDPQLDLEEERNKTYN